MKGAFSQMQKVFEDPEMLSAATNMMKGMGEMVQNPEAALKQLSSSMEDILGDDTKIEEARLQLQSRLSGSDAASPWWSPKASSQQASAKRKDLDNNEEITQI